MQLDAVDRKILTVLQADGSIANAELAQRAGLSESTCLRRVKLLERAGVIERYTAVLNPLKIGMTVSFVVRITLKGQTDRDLGSFEQAVCRVPEVVECYLTTGESDYLLRVVARSPADFERLHSKVLTKLPGVARVDSSFVLRPVVKQAGLPLD
ncbi:MAG TPA: Lrp/AsnC family transcriptional regulator [Steroidobacteraceae bacterium]|jgi:Lrp/AsnC family leucine-responsive transcriptional regulator|nr:Lrp/AsnC family transcriptional regulator [Steroidobacteraceae bacterium]